MAGYANRLITLKFEDLSEPDDLVHVVMRNPKTLPAGELLSKEALSLAETSKDEGAGTLANLETMYPVLAKLVVGWHVYDGTVDTEDMPLLDLPATAESVAKLPFEILQAMVEKFTDVVAPS